MKNQDQSITENLSSGWIRCLDPQELDVRRRRVEIPELQDRGWVGGKWSNQCQGPSAACGRRERKAYLGPSPTSMTSFVLFYSLVLSHPEQGGMVESAQEELPGSLSSRAGAYDQRNSI